MILTGDKIKEEVKKGNITIDPFSVDQVNPNSYNYRLGSKLKIFNGFDGDKASFKKIIIPEEGYVLEPKKMYLSTTKEILGSSKYAMSLIGRSSMGRCGLFLQCSADLGHTTSKHKWTLEMVATLPIKIYPEMVIGQISFWKNYGKIETYKGHYGRINHPEESLIPVNKEKKHDFNRK